jgi:hypothetical protein
MSLEYTLRGYAGAAPEYNLNGTIGTADVSFALKTSGAGWPTANFGVIIDYDNASAEKVWIGTRSGVNCSGVIRGADGTSAKTHADNAKIRHGAFAQDFAEANAVGAALTTKGDSLWKGGTPAVAPARLAAGSDQQFIRYLAANALGVETTWKGSIPIFASTAARDSAIAAPSSGQACYVDSNDTAEGLYFYNGTSWQARSWNAPWGAIAADAVATANQATITTITDLTSCTITFTAIGNRRYKITGEVTLQTTVASDVGALVISDGSNTQVQKRGAFLSTAAGASIPATIVVTPAAGSVTYKLRVLRDAGSGTLTAVATASQPNLIRIEDIGPSGAPT